MYILVGILKVYLHLEGSARDDVFASVRESQFDGAQELLQFQG